MHSYKNYFLLFFIFLFSFIMIFILDPQNRKNAAVLPKLYCGDYNDETFYLGAKIKINRKLSLSRTRDKNDALTSFFIENKLIKFLLNFHSLFQVGCATVYEFFLQNIHNVKKIK